MIIIDNSGSILNDSNFNSNIGGAGPSANAMNKFATKLNIIRNCGNGSGCRYTAPVRHLNGANWSDDIEKYWAASRSKATLAAGHSVLIDIYGSSCTSE